MIEWSDYQKAIFGEIKSGTGNIIVEAMAGSGKTTVIVESLKYLPNNKSWLLTAFNTKNAEELRKRVNLPSSPFVSVPKDIFTMHSFGLKCLGATFNKIEVEQNKCMNILEKMLKGDNQIDIRYNIQKAVSLCKGHLASSKEDIDWVLDNHDIDCLDMDRDEFISHIMVTMDLCKRQPHIVDFEDMIWLPNVLQCKVPHYDNVFLDEYQDTSKAQFGLISQAVQPSPKITKAGLPRKGAKSPGRIIFCGDARQALYSWRGADARSFENLKSNFNASVFSLPVSYRCPIAVIEEAQKIVPDIKAAPDAIQGSVSTINYTEMYNLAKPGCFILSRTNAPMIKVCLSFIRKGVPANIQGRDVGLNLLNMIKNSKTNSVDKFLAYLSKWEIKEIARLTRERKGIEAAKDRAECLRALCDGVTSLKDVKDNINKLFADTDDYGRVLCSTIHRAKGMERDNVFILKSTLFGTDLESDNIRYVAITRSKKSLFFVEKDKKQDKNDKL